MTDPAGTKDLLIPLRRAMADMSEAGVRGALASLLAEDVVVRLFHPVGEVTGAAFYDAAYAPLLAAMPDAERRDLIVMEGADDDGARWVGCMGQYMGSFLGPFLDIPPTGHLAHLRFHEFYRFEGAQVVEVQAIWDLPELMMQAGVWPMAPSLGRELCVPAPMSQDGLGPHDPHASAASRDHVIDMLTHLVRHPAEGGAEVMQAERFWHPRMNWYGPAGIGTARGIAGFRAWHQIPFLNAMPDRKGGTNGTLQSHFFAEGAYVAVTGWPNMQMTVTGDGWLGIAPAGQEITLRSLDFWRMEAGRIRENWVLVDLLDAYAQLGVDVLARLREFNQARVPGRVPVLSGAA
ncbi:ester cyclase [uncultured Roseobacter sp.]|uniref:ester cyclase n=1 Tax=uncultured Roseobacter sp. TaxID=114847 RepID=UPI002617F0F6|nr:ester cyclase [uncultured Roseobacter sp.]